MRALCSFLQVARFKGPVEIFGALMADLLSAILIHHLCGVDGFATRKEVMGGRKTATQQRQRGSGRASYRTARTHQQVATATAAYTGSSAIDTESQLGGAEEWWSSSADPLTESEDDIPSGQQADREKYSTFTLWGSQPLTLAATTPLPVPGSSSAGASLCARLCSWLLHATH